MNSQWRVPAYLYLIEDRKLVRVKEVPAYLYSTPTELGSWQLTLILVKAGDEHTQYKIEILPGLPLNVPPPRHRVDVLLLETGATLQAVFTYGERRHGVFSNEIWRTVLPPVDN